MDLGEIALSDREFERIRQRLYRLAGISLSQAKRTMVVSRLARIVNALGLKDFDAYVDFLEQRAGRENAQDFINALTTNLTRFFREDHHFEHLVDHVGDLIEKRARRTARGRRLRIWSAGCSTGQEAYTIALSLLDHYPELKRWDFKILATDIDTKVLSRAATGLYPGSEADGLSAARAALFERTDNNMVRIPAAARAIVSFKPHNLVADWPMSGPFDAIFCRNVAIYFDKPTQARLFARFADLLAPEGFLYIGHAENIGDASGFLAAGKTIYQHRAARPARTAA